MVTIPRKYQVDRLGNRDVIANPDGSPTNQFIQQWNLMQALVKQVADVSALEIATATPITGGGAIIAGLTIGHADSGVAAGVYGNATNVPQVTIDADGHVTLAANVPISTPTPAAWALIDTHDYVASPVANVDVNVSAYGDIIVTFESVLAAIAGFRQVLLSVDGGATYFNAAGDYQQILTTGGILGSTALTPAGNSSALARSGTQTISASNLTGQPKYCYSLAQGAVQFRVSTLPITHIRINNSAGGNLTGGKTYVLGR